MKPGVAPMRCRVVASREEVVVLPWVPATTSEVLFARKKWPSACGMDR